MVIALLAVFREQVVTADQNAVPHIYPTAPTIVPVTCGNDGGRYWDRTNDMAVICIRARRPSRPLGMSATDLVFDRPLTIDTRWRSLEIG